MEQARRTGDDDKKLFNLDGENDAMENLHHRYFAMECNVSNSMWLCRSSAVGKNEYFCIQYTHCYHKGEIIELSSLLNNSNLNIITNGTLTVSLIHCQCYNDNLKMIVYPQLHWCGRIKIGYKIKLSEETVSTGSLLYRTIGIFMYSKDYLNHNSSFFMVKGVFMVKVQQTRLSSTINRERKIGKCFFFGCLQLKAVCFYISISFSFTFTIVCIYYWTIAIYVSCLFTKLCLYALLFLYFICLP